MVNKITVIDDTDGSTGAVTRKFTLGDTTYEIDLTEDNYWAMLALLKPYLSVARVKHRGNTGPRTNYAPLATREDRAAIRAWAIANNRHIPSRGRFPNDVVRDYYATQAKNPKVFVRG